MLQRFWWWLAGLCPKCGSELEWLPEGFADWYVECKSDDCDYSAEA